jgi:hypothetical protein
MYAAPFEPERLVPLSKGLVGPPGCYVAGRRHFDAMKKKGGNSAVIRSFDLNGGSVNELRAH